MTGELQSVLSLDPGEYFGAAFWVDRQLVSAHFQALPAWPLSVVVAESQDITKRTKNPKNIIKLAQTAGRLVERCHAPEVVWVLPMTWKGNAPDFAVETRILGVLSKDERTILNRALRDVPPDHRHDVTDATGIGLWYLKRLPK